MNFLAHSYRFLHDPYFAAGTCIPDWLGMVDRKTRVRKIDAVRLAQAGDSDQASRSLAGGIVQHLRDDDWFHGTAAFVELSARFSREIACLFGEETGIRCGFLGHILVELLLDGAVAEEHPSALRDHYRVMGDIDTAKMQATVNRMARKPTGKLGELMPRYLAERFLYDYLEDQPLLYRLNGIMRRVNLPKLPDAMVGVIQTARPLVRERRLELLGELRTTYPTLVATARTILK